MIRNSYVLLTALLLETISFYEIIPKKWVVIPGLLYIRLGIRVAPKFPHIGTSIFAGGGLMISYFVTPVFPALGLILVSTGLSILSFRIMRTIDAFIFSLAKFLGIFLFWANVFAIVRAFVNRECFDKLRPIRYEGRPAR